jgi:hypothetical protein
VAKRQIASSASRVRPATVSVSSIFFPRPSSTYLSYALWNGAVAARPAIWRSDASEWSA